MHTSLALDVSIFGTSSLRNSGNRLFWKTLRYFLLVVFSSSFDIVFHLSNLALLSHCSEKTPLYLEEIERLRLIYFQM